MSTDKDSISGESIDSAIYVASIFINQGVPFEYDAPSKCADGLSRWQFRAVDAAGVCIIAAVIMREDNSL